MTNELSSREHNKKLMQALEFDADDLDANHHGYLSKKQRRTLSKLRRSWKLSIVLTVIIAPVFITIAILHGIAIHDTLSSRVGLCVLILLIAAAFSFQSYRKIQRFNQDLLKGDVLSVVGIVIGYHFVDRGETAIQVNGLIFRTHHRSRFYGFTMGERYEIFYTPYSKYILSARLPYEQEPIPEIPKILKANPPIV